MAGEELFGGLPVQAAPRSDRTGQGAPRLREPERDQIELRAVDIDSLVGQEHPVRVIWSYVEDLDLSALEDRIKAREHSPGHPPISPRLLLALWLYATSEGIGSARALERLCENHDAYRWLCGGVSVNYHTLSDFRVGCADLLDRLLAEHVAALAKAGLVNLDALAQDGVRVRASAGAASFRRGATLDRHLAQAQELVATLKREVDANADASNRRIKAAKDRAARERAERLQAAQAALAEIKQQRQRRRDNGKPNKEPRASTTDPAARVMKMADGGFRPAYNVQVASAAGEQIVVAVAVSNCGSDAVSCGRCWSGCANALATSRNAISPTVASTAPKISNGRMTKRSRFIVRRPNPSMAAIPICHDAATATACWPGAPAWRASKASSNTNPARFASASMPAGAIGTCAN